MTLIISAYIISVFLSRWLNKIVYQINNEHPIWVLVWFIPILNILFFTLVTLIVIKKCIKPNWFTGKNW